MWHCLPKPWECLYFAGGLESFSPAFLADNANKFRVMCGLSVFSAKGKGLLIKMPFVFYRKSCPFSYGWRISLLKLGLLFFLCSDLRVTSCILLFSTYKPPQVKHSQVYIIQWLKYFQHKILSGYFLQNIPQICNCGIPWQCEISAYVEVCTDRALHLSVLGRGCFLGRLLCRCRYVCCVAHRRQ